MSNTRNRRRRYAQGHNAIAECQRSGQKMRYRDIVHDGHIPGLLVHPDWYEERHPQELPIDTADAITLWRPAVEISVNAGEFDTLELFNAFVPTLCPASPQDLVFFENTTLAEDGVVGGLKYTLEDAVTWQIGFCLFIELDAGGWFVTQVDMDNPITPAFIIGGITPLTGAASAGNDVFIGAAGSGQPLLNGSWAIT